MYTQKIVGNSPTERLMHAYEAAYRYFRDELLVPVLGETLPDPILTFSRSSKRTLAFFAPDVWRADLDDSERRHELGIVPAHTADDPREVMASLVHEMLHFADYVAGTAPKSSGYHGKKWAARMEKVVCRRYPGRTKAAWPSRTRSSRTDPTLVRMMLCRRRSCSRSSRRSRAFRPPVKMDRPKTAQRERSRRPRLGNASSTPAPSARRPCAGRPDENLSAGTARSPTSRSRRPRRALRLTSHHRLYCFIGLLGQSPAEDNGGIAPFAALGARLSLQTA